MKRKRLIGPQGEDRTAKRFRKHKSSSSYSTVEFGGKSINVTLTSSGREIEAWIRNKTNNSDIIGLDIEWPPSYRKGSENKTALLQLCNETACLVVQMRYVDYIPETLRDFLRSPNIRLVGVGIKQDANKLYRDFELLCEGTVELGPLAVERFQEKGLQNAGLKVLTIKVLGFELEKPRSITMSRWDQRWLRPRQIEYACIDAFVSFLIGKVLLDTDDVTD
eukprot:TRINITY_DN10711_c0_g1_i1.p1 TRINITY_DN10711_c0_g1~~TRINITY_DN10711_c0_g1_i1.p1  ORF type:complete len:221 (+),score=7.29 TRINITY_DN10711_c0_g1_i1:150-812(+)